MTKRAGLRALKTLQEERQSGPRPDTPPKNASLPEIFLEPGKLDLVVGLAEAALLTYPLARVFQRGSVLVRLVRTAASQTRAGLRRHAGALVVTPLEVPYLTEKLTAAARFLRISRRSGKWEDVDCPERVAKTLLARAGEWRFPVLAGILEAPTLRPDGSILEVPGYDAETGLFLDAGSTAFVPIPVEPTREDAWAALELLVDLLKGFPFVEASDGSAAISAILTGLIRKSIRTAPLHAFRAPKMRSGKTLLADHVSLFATGRPCAVMSANHDNPDEEKKRLLSVLLAGDPVICYDNIEEPFGGAAICQALTQESITDRLLGFSRMATAPTSATFLATGNNLVFEGDITARVVPCDLDPRMERPEERRFEVNLYEWIPAHRGELVSAALTILRAYHVAGRPEQDLPPWGGFEEWSDWVRSAIVWLGLPDPAAGRRRIEEFDPARRVLLAMTSAWFDIIGTRIVAAAEVVKASEEIDGAALRSALLDIAATQRGEVNTRRLGNFLQRNERRIEGNLKIERAGDRHGVALWRVVEGGLEGFEGHFHTSAESSQSSCISMGREETNPQNPHNPPGPEDEDLL